MHIKHFEDLWYSVIAEPQKVTEKDDIPHYVNYKIYQIEAQGDGSYSYPFGNERTDNILEADVFISLGVKWDGCCNWRLEEGYSHCCYRGQIINIGEVLARCWDWTAEFIPTFEGEK